MRTLFLSVVIATLLAPSFSSALTLFFDDFEDGRISNAFEFTGNNPEFVEEDGLLKQNKKDTLLGKREGNFRYCGGNRR